MRERVQQARQCTACSHAAGTPRPPSLPSLPCTHPPIPALPSLSLLPPPPLAYSGIRGRFGQRQDLFLPLAAAPVRRAVLELVSNLAPLLTAACGPAAALHELSCIIAQPGAPRQCVHADTIVLPCPQYPDAKMAPLYTFFVALQNVEDGMGHTQVGEVACWGDVGLVLAAGRGDDG